MTPLEPSQHQQIEVYLGRPLSEEEMRPVATVADLSPAQLGVVRHLKARQLVLTTIYLRSLTDISVGDVARFLDRLDSEQRKR